MGTFLHCAIRRGCHQADFTVRYRRNHNHALSHFLFELVTQITQSVHIHTFDLCGDHGDPVKHFCLVCHISHRILGKLAL